MRKKKQPAAPLPPAARRQQPRLRWSSRAIPNRIDAARVMQLYLDRKLVGEVMPATTGNPLRARVDGWVYTVFANDELGLPHFHSGDGREERATTALPHGSCSDCQVALTAFVQERLRARGLRP